jgi:hypothetical protein
MPAIMFVEPTPDDGIPDEEPPATATDGTAPARNTTNASRARVTPGANAVLFRP